MRCRAGPGAGHAARACSSGAPFIVTWLIAATASALAAPPLWIWRITLR